MLVDLTAQARPYGFKIPLACTEVVWLSIQWTEATEARKPEATGQSTDGRLHDVLSLARMAAQGAAQAGAAVVEFEALMVPVDGKATAPRAQLFRLVVSGGDQGEPVLTLMLPGED